MRFMAAVVVFAVLLGGCRGDDSASPPHPTVARATSTTTTSVPADPYAIPETIDVAYVQRVIDKLYEIEAEAVRAFVTHGELVPEGTKALQAVYAVDVLNRTLSDWNDIVASGELSAFRQPPGNSRVTVQEVLAATPRCVFLRLEKDSREVLTDGSVDITYISLTPRVEAQDRQDTNPTPWMISADLVSENGHAPTSPCAH